MKKSLFFGNALVVLALVLLTSVAISSCAKKGFSGPKKNHKTHSHRGGIGSGMGG